MNALSLLCRGVIGIQLLFLGATVTCAQTFVFDFRSNVGEGVFLDSGGLNEITDWNAASNTLGDLDGERNQSGFLFFDLDSQGGFESVELSSSNFLNWTDAGLDDGGAGLNNEGEFISFVFDRAIRMDVLDLGSFLGTDSLSIADSTFLGAQAADNSVLFPDLAFAAGETITIQNKTGTFFLESMTISAVPEPGTVLLGILGAGIAVVTARRRARVGRTEPD